VEKSRKKKRKSLREAILMQQNRSVRAHRSRRLRQRRNKAEKKRSGVAKRIRENQEALSSSPTPSERDREKEKEARHRAKIGNGGRRASRPGTLGGSEERESGERSIKGTEPKINEKVTNGRGVTSIPSLDHLHSRQSNILALA